MQLLGTQLTKQVYNMHRSCEFDPIMALLWALPTPHSVMAIKLAFHEYCQVKLRLPPSLATTKWLQLNYVDQRCIVQSTLNHVVVFFCFLKYFIFLLIFNRKQNHNKIVIIAVVFYNSFSNEMWNL